MNPFAVPRPFPSVGGLAVAAILLLATLAPACPCGTNCQCGAGCQCGSAAPPATPPPPDALQVRQNQRDLTAQQRQDFTNAILTLKNTTRPGESLSVYDTFVQQHGQAFLNGQAHGASAFLPWHRQFLLNFERELQRVNPSVTIPYWDFAVDTTPASWPFTPDFLGGNGNSDFGFAVVDGPFRQGQWKLAFDGPDLIRTFGLLRPTLPTPQDVEASFRIGHYDAPPWDQSVAADESFRQFLEGAGHSTLEPELHNLVHIWLGGSSALIFAPNDPIFWLLHANIDRIWAEWQALYGLTYLPTTGGPRGHNLDDPMFPFGVTPAQTLDHFALGYRYDTETAAVPEPSSWLLLALGVLALWGGRRLRPVNEARPGGA